MKQCPDSEIVTSAKCVFSFLYIVTIMKRIEVPAFRTSFSTYGTDRFRGVDSLLLSAGNGWYYMYYQLDIRNQGEIVRTFLGTWSARFFLTVGNELQYYVRTIDEKYFVADFTDDDNTLDLLNDICKGESGLFESCPSAASRYE